MLRVRHLWVAKKGDFPRTLYRHPGRYITYRWLDVRETIWEKQDFVTTRTSTFMDSLRVFFSIRGPYNLLEEPADAED